MLWENEVSRVEFKGYYDLYAKHPEIFSFISPALIAKYFFEIKEVEDYWNYDISKMIKERIKLVDKLTDEFQQIPVDKFITI